MTRRLIRRFLLATTCTSSAPGVCRWSSLLMAASRQLTSTPAEHLWRTVVGKGPVNHPALKGLALPDMGWDNRTFVLATPNLLLATSQDPHGLADAGEDYFVDRDAYLRAYELESGEEIGRVELPSNAYGAPMSYTAGGRQYVVVPLGNYLGESGRPPELVALAIPQEGEELPPQGRDRGDADHKAFYEAVEAIDVGDAEMLRKLLAEYPELTTACGYFDKVLRIPLLSWGPRSCTIWLVSRNECRCLKTRLN